jgi:hypothetical protein
MNKGGEGQRGRRVFGGYWREDERIEGRLNQEL